MFVHVIIAVQCKTSRTPSDYTVLFGAEWYNAKSD